MIYWVRVQAPTRLFPDTIHGSIGVLREIEVLSVSQRRFNPGWAFASVMISDQGCHSHLKVIRDHSSSHAALATWDFGARSCSIMKQLVKSLTPPVNRWKVS